MTWDFIIVGAGSAGCVLAARLTEDKDCRVLVLEAGGKDDHLYIRMPIGFLRAMLTPGLDWGYKSEPEPNLNGRRLMMPRGRVLEDIDLSEVSLVTHPLQPGARVHLVR